MMGGRKHQQMKMEPASSGEPGVPSWAIRQACSSRRHSHGMTNQEMRDCDCVSVYLWHIRAKSQIAPPHKWIDSIQSTSAQQALRPNGHEYANDKEMELSMRRLSGHVRPVDRNRGTPYPSRLPTVGRTRLRLGPSFQEHQQEQGFSTLQELRAPESIESERKTTPFKKRQMTFMIARDIRRRAAQDLRKRNSTPRVGSTFICHASMTSS